MLLLMVVVLLIVCVVASFREGMVVVEAIVAMVLGVVVILCVVVLVREVMAVVVAIVVVEVVVVVVVAATFTLILCADKATPCLCAVFNTVHRLSSPSFISIFIIQHTPEHIFSQFFKIQVFLRTRSLTNWKKRARLAAHQSFHFQKVALRMNNFL